MSDLQLFQKYQKELLASLTPYQNTVVPRNTVVSKNADGTIQKGVIVNSPTQVANILRKHDETKMNIQVHRDIPMMLAHLFTVMSTIAAICNHATATTFFLNLGVVACASNVVVNILLVVTLNKRLSKQLRQADPGSVLDFVTKNLEETITEQKAQLDELLAMSAVPTEKRPSSNYPAGLSDKDFL